MAIDANVRDTHFHLDGVDYFRGHADAVQLGDASVSLEETMVTMQKAQIGFQATLQVRNRLVQAYTDIMNMQV